jgi:hypothetical protein
MIHFKMSKAADLISEDCTSKFRQLATPISESREDSGRPFSVAGSHKLKEGAAIILEDYISILKQPAALNLKEYISN